jgi:hypothetical protein
LSVILQFGESKDREDSNGLSMDAVIEDPAGIAQPEIHIYSDGFASTFMQDIVRAAIERAYCQREDAACHAAQGSYIQSVVTATKNSRQDNIAKVNGQRQYRAQDQDCVPEEDNSKADREDALAAGAVQHCGNMLQSYRLTKGKAERWKDATAARLTQQQDRRTA